MRKARSKVRELELERLNRLYSALSILNKTVAAVKSRGELFREVCRIAIEQGGYLLAWVGFAQDVKNSNRVSAGLTALGGTSRTVVNPSGGLLRKGHPIGATGIAQVVELYEQLLGRSGARQVAGARVGLAENGGGYLNGDVAALCITILQR